MDPQSPPSVLPEVGADPEPGDAARHWRASLRWTLLMLLAWGLPTFAVGWWAREIDAGAGGVPLAFWLAAQGLPLAYLGLAVVHAVAMGRIDRSCGAGSEDGTDFDGSSRIEP